MKYIIYKITNLANNKIYIGSTVRTFAQRWGNHLYYSKNGSMAKFHSAIRKYGKTGFKKEVIFVTFERENLEIMESHFIDLYNSKNDKIGYNQHDPITGNSLYMGDIMKKEWADPTKREQRIQSMTAGSKKKPIVAVNIESGALTRYESIHAAMRDGYAASSICNNLKLLTKTGQGQVWIYDEGEPDAHFLFAAIDLIGKFNINNTRKVQSHDIKTGVKTIYNSIHDVNSNGYTPKQINRALSGKRKTVDNKVWTYLD